MKKKCGDICGEKTTMPGTLFVFLCLKLLNYHFTINFLTQISL
jgi:hypothetical protein